MINDEINSGYIIENLALTRVAPIKEPLLKESLSAELGVREFVAALDLSKLSKEVEFFLDIYSSLLDDDSPDKKIEDTALSLLETLIEKTSCDVVFDINDTTLLLEDEIENLEKYLKITHMARDALDRINNLWSDNCEGSEFNEQLRKSLDTLSQYTALQASLERAANELLISQAKSHVILGMQIVEQHIEKEYAKGLVDEEIYQKNLLDEGSFKLMTNIDYILQHADCSKGHYDTEERVIYLRVASDMLPFELVINSVHESIHSATHTANRQGLDIESLDEAVVEQLTYDLVMRNYELLKEMPGVEKGIEKIFDVYSEQMDSLMKRISEVNKASEDALHLRGQEDLPDRLEIGHFTAALFSSKALYELQLQIESMK